jgi:hypothetical protein
MNSKSLKLFPSCLSEHEAMTGALCLADSFDNNVEFQLMGKFQLGPNFHKFIDADLSPGDAFIDFRAIQNIRSPAMK